MEEKEDAALTVTSSGLVGLLALAEVAADEADGSILTGNGLLRLKRITGWTDSDVESFFRTAFGTDEIVGTWTGIGFKMDDVCWRIDRTMWKVPGE